MIVATLSFLQSRWDDCRKAFQRCRRNYVTPLALQGGRDMVLLRSGGWVDALPDIPEEAISCRYLADQQQIVYAGGSRLVRFPWLAVVDETHDMTDFFTDLRISVGQDIMNEDVMSLYTHQRQRFPRGPIQITTRDGDEIELDEDFQETIQEDSSGAPLPASPSVQSESPSERSSESPCESPSERLSKGDLDASGDTIAPKSYPPFTELNYIK